MGAFEELFAVNVNDHTEKKVTGGTSLTYLSWPFAWAEVKKRYPEATYEIEKFNGLPYAYDPLTGYMVYTKVTIEGVTHEMWLPVMDSANQAMKSEPYEVTTKYKKFTVKPATMFDVNKTIMRCLVKNLAMFGLGLYIYAGEDLPITEKEQEPPQEPPTEASKVKVTPAHVNTLLNLLAQAGIHQNTILTMNSLKSLDELTMDQWNDLVKQLQNRIKEKAKK